ncbi:MAG: hypothetical protein WBW79_04295, partial [Desulfocapsaceae bacterium]
SNEGNNESVWKKDLISSHSQDKAGLVLELALLVSQDVSGITYCDDIDDIVAVGGVAPDLAGVISIAVC